MKRIARFKGLLISILFLMSILAIEEAVMAEQDKEETTAQNANIDILSAVSLYLELFAKDNENPIMTATGFAMSHNSKYYLITNWHVVSGRNPDSNEQLLASIPHEIRIRHHSQELGEWIMCKEHLYNAQDAPRWIEHPSGHQIDVIALPLENIDAKLKLYSLNLLYFEKDMAISPAMTVSIIGFPFGLSSYRGFPIWKTGHIASDPDLDYQNRPAFLVDATMRQGMSGSPVFRRVYELYLPNPNAFTMKIGGSATRFLGIFSGALEIPVDDKSKLELGLVWKPQVIEDILGQISTTSNK